MKIFSAAVPKKGVFLRNLGYYLPYIPAHGQMGEKVFPMYKIQKKFRHGKKFFLYIENCSVFS